MMMSRLTNSFVAWATDLEKARREATAGPPSESLLCAGLQNERMALPTIKMGLLRTATQTVRVALFTVILLLCHEVTMGQVIEQNLQMRTMCEALAEQYPPFINSQTASESELLLAKRCAVAFPLDKEMEAVLGRISFAYGVRDSDGKPTMFVECLRRVYDSDPDRYRDEYAFALSTTNAWEKVIQLLEPSLETASARGLLRWAEASLIMKRYNNQDLFDRLYKWALERGKVEVGAADAVAVSDLYFLLSQLVDSPESRWDLALAAKHGRYCDKKNYQAGARLYRQTRIWDQALRDIFHRVGIVNESQADLSIPLDEYKGFSTPIFIVGLERSGTTLLEQILDMHPDIHGLGETTVFSSTLPSVLCTSDPFDESTDNSPNCYMNLEFLKPQNKIKTGIECLERYQALYNKQHHTESSTSKVPQYITDKLPLNWRNIPMIRAVLPHAKILVLRRDVRDVFLSQFTSNFLPGHMHQTEDVDKLVEYLNYFTTTMDAWQSIGISWFDVSYTSLVQNPRKVLQNIMLYLDLPWNDLLLQHESSTRTPNTLSREQVTHKIYTTSVDRWLPYKELIPTNKLIIQNY